MQYTGIILVLGPLAAGKTTLLRHILAHSTRRLALLQNQFADQMGIQAPTILDAEGKPFDRLVQLANGCLCCSSTGDTVKAVKGLVESYPDIEYLLVQANGLANPAMSVKTFWIDQGSIIKARLHSVVTILNVLKIEGMDEAISLSDTVILNYCDQLQNREHALARVATINPSCQLLQTSFGQVQIQDLIKADMLSFDLERLNGLEQAAEYHAHQEYNSKVWKGLKLGKSELEGLMEWLLWQSSFQIVRVKGVFGWQEKCWSLQGVSQVFEIKEQKGKGVDSGTLLVISRGEMPELKQLY